MRFPSLLLTTLALTACPGPDPDPDGSEQVCGDSVDNDNDGLADCADDDCADSADCAELLATSCPDGTVAMQALDLPVANGAYSACLADDPSNSEAAFGVALTELLLLGDWSSSAQALQWCSQSTAVSEEMFGTDGVVQTMDDAYRGSAELTVRYDPEDGGTAVPLTSLSDPNVVLTELWERDDSNVLLIDIASTIGGGSTLYLRIPVNDVYDDGSNVQLETGRTYSVNTLAEESGIRYRAACDEPGSRCDGFAQSGEPDGSITFSSIGETAGSTVSFDIDATFPANCEDTPCLGAHTILGSVSDTVGDLPEIEDLPFGDLDPACHQSGVRCDYDTEFLSIIADVCDVSSFDAARGLVGDMSDEFDAIADVFEQAASDSDLTFTMPTDRLFFAHSTRTFNQADAHLVAATVRSMAATTRLGAQYNWLNPSSSPDDMASTYSSAYYDYNSETCEPYSTTGVSQDALVDAADGHLGTHVSNADFDGVRDALVAMTESAKDALNSDPTGEGFIDPSQSGSNYAAWLGALEADVDALLASLQGTDGALPSAPGVQFAFDDFFNAPTERTTLLSELGSDAFVTTWQGECRDYVEADYELGDWILNGGDFGRLPLDSSFDSCTSDAQCTVAGETCNLDYYECEQQLPMLFEYSWWVTIEDADGIPAFFTEQARDQAGEWDY